MKSLLLLLVLFQADEAARAARIAELEAQLKTLEAQLAAISAARAAAEPWKPVASWKGNGSKNTESFVTKTGEWRIAWKMSSGDGVLSVTVYDSQNEVVDVAVIANGAGSDVSYVRAKPGRYYLTINSAATNWEITVEERR